MDYPKPPRYTFYSSAIYTVLCEENSYTNIFRHIIYNKLAEYPTEEYILTSSCANIHRFKIPRYGGFSEINLLTKDLTSIDTIRFMFADTYVLDLNKNMLRLVYGPIAIMTLSDMFSCYKDQPVITEMPMLELEVILEEDKREDVSLVLKRTYDYTLYYVKPDQYPIYSCNTQAQVNTMLIEKLNELTIMINSGNFTQTELIKTVNKQQRRIPINKDAGKDTKEKSSNIKYYNEYCVGNRSDCNIYLCLEYKSYVLNVFARTSEDINNYPDTFYMDISHNSGYMIGFYLYMIDFTDVFESLSSIWIMINGSNGASFEFRESDCFKYGSVIFVSLVKEFTANRKPWLIKDWIEIFEEAKIPSLAREQLELKVNFIKEKDGGQKDKHIIIIPVSLNARMCDQTSMSRFVY